MNSLGEGRRRVGMADVARRAGCSVATVSHVINGTRAVSEQTRQRVRSAIEELGYVRNAAARLLRTGTGDAVGILVLDISNPYFMKLARGAEDCLAEHGGTMILGSTDGQDSKEVSLISRLVSQSIKGLIVTPGPGTAKNLQLVSNEDFPVILMTDEWDEAGCSTVGLDDTVGGRLAVERLISRGCKRILMINGMQGMRHCETRWAGAQQAANGHDGVLVSALWNTAGRADTASLITAELHRTPEIDGIFCLNDMTALIALKVLRAEGRKVPDDVAVIGYDDLAFASELMTPLTTIRQPSYRMGWAAMEVLLRGVTQHVVFRPELIVRESA
ncbi:hypothetical protein HMPREF1531_02499 [Propionibacterium sp. oral taxon 192 str. F0372]|uniref:LacI family DNA-binding transcriptional regulator n=1 Tax=Propionibacterium sp. oral taxon 192 TaxID=671222 RepID=UPI0003534B61|nr:LacI family DNA-binding transcriptional regulator [Propionibacterium sp. oral taxon 192]EPH00390.1 hypothetical protein HMPREF1531_02499 [Propionibacterium sp. oral taxon 192 str. F0372]